MIPLLSGFLFGIFLGSFYHISFATLVSLLLLSAIIFAYIRFTPETHRRTVMTVGIFCIAVLLGMFRTNVSNLYTHSTLDHFVGQNVQAEGIIVSEPDVREHTVQLTIGLRSVMVGTTT